MADVSNALIMQEYFTETASTGVSRDTVRITGERPIQTNAVEQFDDEDEFEREWGLRLHSEFSGASNVSKLVAQSLVR